jgi:MoaA/NifB/PqqE/SkfB family radical SAM enzyme
MAHLLIAAGIDRISVSFEGYDKQTYESYRVGSNFERVVENVRRLKEIKEGLGLEKPYIRVQSVMVPEMIGHTAEYAAFWAPYVDEVAYLDMKTENVPFDYHVGRTSPWGCPFLWQRMTICADGHILMCPHDIAEWEILGDVRFISIKDAWLGSKLGGNRKLHQSGYAHAIRPCDRCPLRALEIEKLEGTVP